MTTPPLDFGAAEGAPAPTGAQRGGLRRIPVSVWLLFLITAVSVGGVVWGAYFAHPDVTVRMVDGGPVSALAIGKVHPLVGENVYLVGLEDGRVRAVDGLVASSGCAVAWHADDETGRARNPQQQPGVFVDPCTGRRFSMTGDALDSEEPLRAFQIRYNLGDDGYQHVRVEVIGKRAGRQPLAP